MASTAAASARAFSRAPSRPSAPPSAVHRGFRSSPSAASGVGTKQHVNAWTKILSLAARPKLLPKVFIRRNSPSSPSSPSSSLDVSLALADRHRVFGFPVNRRSAFFSKRKNALGIAISDAKALVCAAGASRHAAPVLAALAAMSSTSGQRVRGRIAPPTSSSSSLSSGWKTLSSSFFSSSPSASPPRAFKSSPPRKFVARASSNRTVAVSVSTASEAHPARAEAASAKKASPAPTPSPSSLPSTSLPSSPGPSFNAKDAALVLLGVGTAMAGIHLSSHIVESLETIPALAQFEQLIGAAVSSNFALTMLQGGEGRAKIERSFYSVVDRMMGKEKAEREKPREKKRNVLDPSLPFSPLAPSPKGVQGVITSSPSLLPPLPPSPSSSVKILPSVSEDSSPSFSPRERESAKEAPVLLKERLDKAMSELSALTRENKTLRESNEELKARVAQVLEDNRLFSSRISSLEGEKEREKEKILARLAEQRKGMEEDLREKEKQLTELRERTDREKEKMSKEAEEAMLRAKNLELEYLGREKWLQSQLDSLKAERDEEKEREERAGLAQANGQGAGKTLGRSLSFSSVEPLSPSLPPLFPDNKSSDKGATVTRDFSSTVSSVSKTLKNSADIRSQLDALRQEIEAASSRALSAEKKILSFSPFSPPSPALSASTIQEKTTEADSSSFDLPVEFKSILSGEGRNEKDQKADLPSLSLSPALSDPLSPSPLASSRAQTMIDEIREKMRKEVGEREAEKERVDDARLSPSLPRSQSFSERSPAREKKRGRDTEEERLSPIRMSDEEIKIYASAVFSSFVDVTKSLKEQGEGVEEMVKDLVSKGAKEHWARYFVRDALLKPSLSLASEERARDQEKEREFSILPSSLAGETPKEIPPSSSLSSSPPSSPSISLDELRVYAKAIHSAFLDSSLPLENQGEGVEKMVEELVAMGASPSWARDFICNNFIPSSSSSSKSSDVTLSPPLSSPRSTPSSSPRFGFSSKRHAGAPLSTAGSTTPSVSNASTAASKSNTNSNKAKNSILSNTTSGSAIGRSVKAGTVGSGVERRPGAAGRARAIPPGAASAAYYARSTSSSVGMREAGAGGGTVSAASASSFAKNWKKIFSAKTRPSSLSGGGSGK